MSTENHLSFRRAKFPILVIISIGFSALMMSAALNAASGKSRFVRFQGMRVHYESYGNGKDALIFIHGWTCNLSFWREQIPAFVAKARLLAIDLPGHGQSDIPDTQYSMDLFCRSINAVMKDAGIERATLVGHSMGTPVIRQFYRRYPLKTRALVFVDGGLRPFGDKAAMDKFIDSLRSPDFKNVAARMVDGMLSPVKDAALRQVIRSQMLSTPQRVAVSAMEGMNDPDIWNQDRIDVPVLAVYAQSPIWTPEYEGYVRSLAPSLDYQVVDGVSHFLMMEKPQVFNDLLDAFLVRNRLIRN